MSRVFIVILIFGLAATFTVSAQAPVFSQHYATGLYLNPALSGTHSDIFFGVNYRSQWSNIDLPFKTFQFSYIHPLMRQGPRVKHFGGIGISFFNDAAGANEEFLSTGINIAGAYNLHLNPYGNNIISMGMQAGLVQTQYNSGYFKWGTQYDPATGYDGNKKGESFNVEDRYFYPAVNIGVVWSYRNKKRYVPKEFASYTGFSISNINRPNEAVVGNDRHAVPLLYRIHGGFRIYLNKQYSVSPNYLISYQNNILQTNIGGYITYLLSHPHQQEEDTRLAFGTWYRLHDSFIFSAAFQSRRFNVGFSYDMNTSSLGRFMGNTGAYELSLAVKILRQHMLKKFSTPLI